MIITPENYARHKDLADELMTRYGHSPDDVLEMQVSADSVTIKVLDRSTMTERDAVYLLR